MTRDLHTDELVHNPRAATEPEAVERLFAARLDRRRFLGGLSLGAALLPFQRLGRSEDPREVEAALAAGTDFVFEAVAPGITVSDRWPKGYRAQVLIAAGDPLWSDAPAYAPGSTDAEAQARQFGTNNDFLAFMPLPRGSSNGRHGLLCANHEYSNAHMLWPGLGKGELAYRESREKATRAQAAVEMAAHGHAVLEIARGEDGGWRVVAGSRYTRRITASTEMLLRGPAAGHSRLKTTADQSGLRVRGTLNNCAGGVTPWGTVLFAEENFHKYFRGDTSGLDGAADYARYGIADDPEYSWGRPFDDGAPAWQDAEFARFRVEAEPNECHRFGWMVEYDPYDPNSVPKKRTALGRFKHEGADVVIDADGHAVAYLGDDERFEYLYRFVSKERFVAGDGAQAREANERLLDEGTLYVARFHESGLLSWLPLVFGEGPLTAAHGFADQAEVLIFARRAADLLAATPLDRPEEVQVDPRTGRVYVMLTNNSARSAAALDGPNPRAKNLAGHVLEILPPGKDGRRAHAANQFRWNVFLLGGEGQAAGLRCPDNCAFDQSGRLWIATDGTRKSHPANTPQESIAPDGLWAIATDAQGAFREARLFYACPTGAELCGPCFTPDGETLFVAVQHPGEDSSFEAPSTRWPLGRQPDSAGDVTPTMAGGNAPPRSAVVAITKLRPASADQPFDPRIGC
jgi:secreted PhoX family phosphatase